MGKVLVRGTLILIVATLGALHVGSASATPNGRSPQAPDLTKVQVFLNTDEHLRVVLEALLANGEPLSHFRLGPDIYPTYALKPPPKARVRAGTADADDLLTFGRVFVPVRKASNLVAVLTIVQDGSSWKYASLIEDIDLIQIFQKVPSGAAPFYDPVRGAWLSLQGDSVEPIGEQAKARLGSSWTFNDYANAVADYQNAGPTEEGLMGGPLLPGKDPRRDSPSFPWLVMLLVSVGVGGTVGMISWVRAGRARRAEHG